MSIFSHEDHNKDSMAVTQGSRERLYFYYATSGATYVELDKRDVRRLYDALGQWLGEDPAPEPVKPNAVLGDLVREVARDEVAKILNERGDHVRQVARQEIRNFLTRAVEMGVDR